MNFDMLEWIVIIGGVMLLVMVLLDGYRRMRGDSWRMWVSVKKEALEQGQETGADREMKLPTGELPNGGARVLPGNGGSAGAPAATGRADPKLVGELVAG